MNDESNSVFASAAALDSSIARMLMDATPDHIYFKDLESRFVRNNLAQARMLGATSPDECVGKSDFDYFSHEHAAQARADELEIIRTGVPLVSKVEHITLRDGSSGWVSTTKLPWRDDEGRIIGTFGLTRDITAGKEAGLKLEAERVLLHTIIENLPARIFVKDASARFVLNNQAHLTSLGAADQAAAIGHTTLDFHPGERGQKAMDEDNAVLRTGKSILHQEKSQVDASGATRWSLMTKVPIYNAEHKINGLVGISYDITQRKLAEQELARRNAEMEADLIMARQLQESFLSRPYPVFPRGATQTQTALRFAHCYVPATTLGGDFFEIIQLSDTRCGLLLCDVMGHGVRAGLLTALIRGVLQEMGGKTDDPAHVMCEINAALCPLTEHTGTPLFATSFFALIDTEAHTLRYTNAGHPAPLVIRGDATLDRLALIDPEPAAGIIADFPYTSTQVSFSPGDRLFVYTDGLIEASDAHGAMFGEERLAFQLGQAVSLPVTQTCSSLLGAVREFTGHADTLEDDACIVTVEFARL